MIRDKVWYDMGQTKFREFYLAFYLDRQKSIRKWYKILTLFFSTGGVLGWKIWAGFPVIACGLISVMQIVNLFQNVIILSEDDFNKLAELRNKHVLYCNKLERLWIELNGRKLSEQEATDNYYKDRTFAEEIELLDNKLNIRSLKSLKQKADQKTRSYLHQHYSSQLK